MSRFKAKILRVGTVVVHADGSFEPRGWSFDGCGKAIALEISDTVYFGGWSARELAEVAQRPSEFVDMELPT